MENWTTLTQLKFRRELEGFRFKGWGGLHWKYAWNLSQLLKVGSPGGAQIVELQLFCGTEVTLLRSGQTLLVREPLRFLGLHGNILTNSPTEKRDWRTIYVFMNCLMKSQSCLCIEVICRIVLFFFFFPQINKSRLHLRRFWLSRCFSKALQVILIHGQGWGQLKGRVKFQRRTLLWITSPKFNINWNLLCLLNGFKIACLKSVKFFCGKVCIMLWFIH